MKVICYRGGGGESPENTIAGIEHCQKVNAKWPIEIDINLTKDGQVILFHDSDTHRITGESHTVSETTYESLKALNAGFYFEQGGKHPFRASALEIPLLGQVLEQFPAVDFIFDIHSNSIVVVDKFIAVIEKYRPTKTITVVSGHDHIIDEFKKRKPEWKYAAATKEAKRLIYSSFAFLDLFFPLRSDYLMIPKQYGNIKVLTKRIIRHVKRRNRQLFAWVYEGEYVKTVDNLEEFEALKKLGVDGVFTDFPEKLNSKAVQ